MGKKSTEYYDMKTSLKVREVSTGQGMDGNPTIQTVDMSDYKAVGRRAVATSYDR